MLVHVFDEAREVPSCFEVDRAFVQRRLVAHVNARAFHVDHCVFESARREEIRTPRSSEDLTRR
jgi:hypothetical protein